MIAPGTLGCDGSTTCWRSTQQRCSGGPTTARTYETGTSNSFSSGRHRYSYAGAGAGAGTTMYDNSLPPT